MIFEWCNMTDNDSLMAEGSKIFIEVWESNMYLPKYLIFLQTLFFLTVETIIRMAQYWAIFVPLSRFKLRWVLQNNYYISLPN